MAKNPYRRINWQGGKYELHIINNKVDYVPIVVDSVKWTTQWCDSPGELSFTILKDNNLNITEGNVVIFKADNVGVFYGYLFKKSKGKDGNIECKAYDQLRYFKNKDTYCYKSRKYSDLLKLIANDYLLICGDIVDTGYKIPVRVEDNTTLFDMLQYARKSTLYSTGKLYILYDDFGQLSLKGIESLKTDYWLNEKTAEDFKYETSIDDNVYNRVQFYRDDDKTGNRAKYIYEDGDCINQWGVLQTTIKLEDGDKPELYGKYLLNTYKQKKRTLSVSGCFGDVKLRAGASLYVTLNVGDVQYDKALFFITKATHTFDKQHTCDLELAGQENFIGEVS